MTDLIRFEVSAGIARLTLDNPRRMDAVNAEMWQALPAFLAQVAEDPAIRVLVLAGAGERAFCTGNDIREFDTIRADPEAAARYNGWQRTVAYGLQRMEKPIIAAMHGYCLGAGFEFALMSDFRHAAADTRVGIPAVKLGLPYRLEDIEKVADVVGLGRPREMCCSAGNMPERNCLASVSCSASCPISRRWNDPPRNWRRSWRPMRR